MLPGIVDEREIEHAYPVIAKYMKHTVMGNICMRERKIEEKRGTVYSVLICCFFIRANIVKYASLSSHAMKASSSSA